jgi:tetratricopeptide (TPR) repeat protein
VKFQWVNYQNAHNKMGEAHCLKVLSDLYLVTERYDDAQECYRRAAELLNTDNPIMFAACLKGQGGSIA